MYPTRNIYWEKCVKTVMKSKKRMVNVIWKRGHVLKGKGLGWGRIFELHGMAYIMLCTL